MENDSDTTTNKDQVFVSSYTTINQSERTDFPGCQPAEGL